MKQYAIGIDIGGTTVKGAIIAGDGLIRRRMRVPTDTSLNGARILETVITIIGRLIEQEGGSDHVFGVGIGAPGFIDRDGTVIGKAVNLPGWEGMQLCRPVKERFALRAVAANDALAMTLAEARFGAGRGVADMVCYALGTGIGGGIVTGGNLHHGTRGMAGEFGHVSIDPGGIPCGCGQKGCVERYASAPGIVYWAREICETGRVEETDFVRIVRAGGDAVTAKLVYEFVNRGDPVARRVNEFVCDKLSRAVGITINTLAPELVVLGGGVMMAGQVIVDTVRKHLPKYSLPEMLKTCEVRAAELGEDAGVIGAGALVFDAAGKG
jgi:glucokinase